MMRHFSSFLSTMQKCIKKIINLNKTSKTNQIKEDNHFEVKLRHSCHTPSRCHKQSPFYS